MAAPPFRTVVDDAWSSDPAVRIRWRRSLDFVRASGLRPGSPAAGLDVGDRTQATAMLEEHFGCRFDTTAVDLDTGEIGGRYDVVVAFEVLEHLFNPLHLLLELKRSLSPGPASRLFLSTPAWKPWFLRSPDHFHEMPLAALDALLDRAGFTIVRSAVFRIRPHLFCMKGFRPLMRCFFERIRIYELAAREG